MTSHGRLGRSCRACLPGREDTDGRFPCTENRDHRHGIVGLVERFRHLAEAALAHAAIGDDLMHGGGDGAGHVAVVERERRWTGNFQRSRAIVSPSLKATGEAHHHAQTPQ
jgi:hypothetical protein